MRTNTVGTNKDILVLGLGEVGKPLFELISKHRRTIGIDIAPIADEIREVEVMHVCYPFQIDDFVGQTARYIDLFKPELTIVNSTVGVGTTRKIAEKTGASVVNSPVRGKHVKMFDELCKYVKFVGALDSKASQHAVEHFESIGLKARALSSPEATELAKLTETTYFGLMIAWAQELERYCDQTDVDYEEIVSFYEEIKFFPSVKYFPGVIGGHCVMPNIAILQKQFGSQILASIENSNRMKVEREARIEAATQMPERVAV
jgi:UDP-N-acetyl-D-mannosaminuronate dehydrogenase